jgi:glucose/arabinose dehydrogenase
MIRKARAGSIAALVLVLGASMYPWPAVAQSTPTAPAGFAVTPYASIGGATTSLAFGPDTRNLSGPPRLYVTNFTDGEVVAIDDTGSAGGPPVVFASGFRNPLGVVVAPNGTVFVSDAEAERNGPFGNRQYGRVWRVRDTNGDGVADVKKVVLRNLPNGRHNTNGLALGSDGMLYVTNGNSTDDGVEGGQPEVLPWSGSVLRVNPGATGLSVTNLNPSSALVARGMRNDFDLAFSPFDRTKLFITMNGVDDARQEEDESPVGLEDSDDLLYLADVDNRRAVDDDASRPVIEHFGFPSCLYNVERQGNLQPYNNPNPETIERFGPCRQNRIVRPRASFGAHPSADGLAFQTTNAWGPDFRRDLFVAEFGNFFGDEVVGHKVVRVELDAGGTQVVSQSDFLSGGAPLDVTFRRSDGSLFVLDFSGEIFKVTKVA